MAINFTSTTGQTRFSALASGEIDMLARNTTWTLTRDVDLGNTFAGVNYYDGQGFMVNRDLGVTSATELSGATICIQTGTTTELNLADFFRVNDMEYEPVPVETNAEAQQQYSGPRLRRVHDGLVRSGRDARLVREPARSRHPARDHLEGTARARWSAKGTSPGAMSCAGR